MILINSKVLGYEKSMKKTMKIHSNFALKKQRKHRVKIGSGTLQGSILKSFGERLSAVWALLGAFLAFLARSGALLGCLLGFMSASDLILRGFGKGLGGIWRGFGKGFAKVLEGFGRICFDFLHCDPRAVSLRPAERHNFICQQRQVRGQHPPWVRTETNT